MTAVIYNPDTVKIIKRFKTLGGAKAALTRARKGAGLKYMASFGYGRIKGAELEKLKVTTLENFSKEIDGWTTVKNMMSDKEVRIRKSDVGGPCDPSTERYWSM